MYRLPSEIQPLINAHRELCNALAYTGRKFALDGNLVGDIGEIAASELFELRLESPGSHGIDGKTIDGKSVQIKASGVGKSYAFTCSQVEAEKLICLHVHFDDGMFEIVYNGPYSPVRRLLPENWKGQKMIGIGKLCAIDRDLSPSEKLPIAKVAMVVA